MLVFKSGVGIAALAIGKWTDAKSIAICDHRQEVLRNAVKNCNNNGVSNITSFIFNLQDIQSATIKYDHIICPDLIALGLAPQLITTIFNSLLKEGGEAVIIMQEKKEQARKLLEGVNKKEFKITNLILTAE